MSEQLISDLVVTAIHVIELAAVVVVTVLAVKVFHVDSATQMALIAMLVAAVTKFVRQSPSIPVPDYVNGKN